MTGNFGTQISRKRIPTVVLTSNETLYMLRFQTKILYYRTDLYEIIAHEIPVSHNGAT